MIAQNPEHNAPETLAAEAPSSEAARLLSALNWRYAVKKFDTDKHIDPSTWNTLEEALLLTASGIGLHPWKFIVVTAPAVRARLREVSYNQPQIVEADRIVVFAARVGYSAEDTDRFIARVA